MVNTEDKRKEILSNLKVIRNRLINILSHTVEREVRIDPSGLGANPNRQAELKNAINGLCILYYFSFLQSNISEDQWRKIKRSDSEGRGNFKNVIWKLFDALKYIRDCFGHDYQGTLFPSTQENTCQFIDITQELGDQKNWEIENNRIILKDAAVSQTWSLVKEILENADIAI